MEISFRADEGVVKAVDSIDFQVQKGRTLGIVGESGSGKSVSARALMKLLPKNAVYGDRTKMTFHMSGGRIIDIAALEPNCQEMQNIRGGEISMIFQEPMASFSPVYSIGNQMMEAILLHRNVDKKEAREITLNMLDQVGISNAGLRIDQYSHELSGGMRQRAMIAIALVTNPSLLIADEPTTALDMTIQAQILELIQYLQNNLHMAVVFITHNMGVIAHVAHDVAVMYLGSIVECGPMAEVIHNPKHPYTQGLVAALPNMDHLGKRLTAIPGDIPSPLERPAGCPFHPRCPKVMWGICDRTMPQTTQIGAAQVVKCFLYK
jgi:peptide/nickel transport system ATP-binding protein